MHATVCPPQGIHVNGAFSGDYIAMQMYHDYDNYCMHEKLVLLVDFNGERHQHKTLRCQHNNYIHMIDYPINAH